MRLLLIEDDLETASYVIQALNGRGHKVETAFDGDDGLKLANNGAYDAMVVDRMLPGMDGLSLVKKLRAHGDRTPVLFLTTMSGLDDRVEGLEAGGDDYLTKPFAIVEFLARVNAISRRHNSEITHFTAGDLEMDLLRRTVRRGGQAVELQPQEFLLLEYLLRNAGRIVTRTMLLENVWNMHFDPRTNIVETHMSRLRSKVDRGHITELIHTIRGTGYVLRAD